jgi:ABC-type bacteriocin/lantibiotic exporter with double-glycine peptidase domain
MRTITDKLIWLLAGIFCTHIGHFVYQKYYAEDFSVIRLSECIAMIVEGLLQLMLHFLDKVLPLFIASRELILVVIALLVLMTIFFIWFKIYLRVKSGHQYNAKIKEAEAVLAAAREKAAGEMQKVKVLEEKLTTEFEKKETALQQEVKEKLKEYMVRIKKLEKERLELKEMNGSLMLKLKNT